MTLGLESGEDPQRAEWRAQEFQGTLRFAKPRSYKSHGACGPCVFKARRRIIICLRIETSLFCALGQVALVFDFEF